MHIGHHGVSCSDWHLCRDSQYAFLTCLGPYRCLGCLPTRISVQEVQLSRMTEEQNVSKSEFAERLEVERRRVQDIRVAAEREVRACQAEAAGAFGRIAELEAALSRKQPAIQKAQELRGYTTSADGAMTDAVQGDVEVKARKVHARHGHEDSGAPIDQLADKHTALKTTQMGHADSDNEKQKVRSSMPWCYSVYCQC